ncbi:MAG: 30S ribosome-binding factor RbfA [Phycisphaerae bacterium]|nr:30S ribosome-binding factor RbfA [Phycisphaerae bacterium]
MANVIRGIVAEAIQSRLGDPRIEQLTSVTAVDVAPDFAVARVYVSVMAPANRQELTLSALRSAAGRLRRMVRSGLATRQIPMLEFYLDESIQRGMETVNQLDQLMREQGDVPAFTPEDTDEASADSDAAGDADHPDMSGEVQPGRAPQSKKDG